MKAWKMSDLHIDVGPAPLDLVDRPEHDLVIIAGDICEHLEKGIAWIVEQRLNEKPVVVVPGNHEFYRNHRDKGLQKGKAAAAAAGNIHVLQDEVLEVGSLRIIGATLWTDYRLFGEAHRGIVMDACERFMNDHRSIRLANKNYRKWLARDAAAEHAVSRAFIERELAATPPWQRAVVVTHHAPSIKSLPEDRRKHTVRGPAYASDLEAIACRADFWLHGHIHPGMPRYQLGNCWVISNPRGYAIEDEDYGFDPQLVIDLDPVPVREVREAS